MFQVTKGTQKQIDYANDILRRPIYCVLGWIAQREEAIGMKYKGHEADRDRLNVLAPVLHDAIAMYEQTIAGAADQLTAQYVIDNYKRTNPFWRLMRSCVGAAMQKAGIECKEPTVYMSTDKRYWPENY